VKNDTQAPNKCEVYLEVGLHAGGKRNISDERMRRIGKLAARSLETQIQQLTELQKMRIDRFETSQADSLKRPDVETTRSEVSRFREKGRAASIVTQPPVEKRIGLFKG